MAKTIFPRLRGTSARPKPRARQPAERSLLDGAFKAFFGGSRSKQGRKPPFSN